MAQPPPGYLDECVDYALAPSLRRRGFTLHAAVELGTEHLSDDEQLRFAAGQGWIILTHNRAHFRRWHARFLATGEVHSGIIGLPQRQHFSRLELRAAMMLRWIADQDHRSRSFNWNDLQQELLNLCTGRRAPAFHEFGPDEVAHALDW
ncbi:MAG: DUF5615 family PIN-like protein [Chloroflexota bacterium]